MAPVTPWTRTMKLQAFILAFCAGIVIGVAIHVFARDTVEAVTAALFA